MKQIQVLTLLVVLSLTTFVAKSQNAKAAQILEEVSTKTQSYKNIKVSFAYIMENKESDIYEHTHGTLFLADNKYRLSISGQEVICDGKSIWTYIPDIKEVQINEVSDDEGFTPQKLLSNYTEDFIPKREKDVMLGVRAAYSIKLKPKVDDAMVKNAVLLIDKRTKQLLSFVFHDFEGNSFTYNIKDFVTDTELPKDVFTFDTAQYPNVEVIDMR